MIRKNFVLKQTIGLTAVRIALFVASLLLISGYSPHADAASFPLLKQVRAFVTGYNTIPGQTDDTPCIGASGANICGRTDAVACPRKISLGTRVEIRGSSYICEDRLAKKFDSRFDISCDKDIACPPQVTGWVVVKVFPGDRVPRPIPAQLPATAAPMQPAATETPAAPTVAAPPPAASTPAAPTMTASAHINPAKPVRAVTLLRGRGRGAPVA